MREPTGWVLMLFALSFGCAGSPVQLELGRASYYYGMGTGPGTTAPSYLPGASVAPAVTEGPPVVVTSQEQEALPPPSRRRARVSLHGGPPAPRLREPMTSALVLPHGALLSGADACAASSSLRVCDASADHATCTLLEASMRDEEGCAPDAHLHFRGATFEGSAHRRGSARSHGSSAMPHVRSL